MMSLGMRKKQFLSEKGFEVQGVDRKLINKLFRDEMREYQPFKVLEWTKETFSGKEAEWEQRYQQAKADFIKRQEMNRLAEDTPYPHRRNRRDSR